MAQNKLHPKIAEMRAAARMNTVGFESGGMPKRMAGTKANNMDDYKSRFETLGLGGGLAGSAHSMQAQAQAYADKALALGEAAGMGGARVPLVADAGKTIERMMDKFVNSKVARYQGPEGSRKKQDGKEKKEKKEKAKKKKKSGKKDKEKEKKRKQKQKSSKKKAKQSGKERKKEKKKKKGKKKQKASSSSSSSGSSSSSSSEEQDGDSANKRKRSPSADPNGENAEEKSRIDEARDAAGASVGLDTNLAAHTDAAEDKNKRRRAELETEERGEAEAAGTSGAGRGLPASPMRRGTAPSASDSSSASASASGEEER